MQKKKTEHRIICEKPEKENREGIVRMAYNVLNGKMDTLTTPWSDICGLQFGDKFDTIIYESNGWLSLTTIILYGKLLYKAINALYSSPTDTYYMDVELFWRLVNRSAQNQQWRSPKVLTLYNASAAMKSDCSAGIGKPIVIDIQSILASRRKELESAKETQEFKKYLETIEEQDPIEFVEAYIKNNTFKHTVNVETVAFE
ncbi:unnamed protein product [Orchesella dallaii]|uniref:Uncharacterized protein n=1 Tax=Orchesella dallaii TaxID=48710 RepID=A0ABP1PU91_9HEXA